ncbi:hypothetical protein GC722_11235 [Auraticoccus sp. F435]|uniref:Bulb-type lectin domain-containing protein n=1 Tax=Auraticoccus cholistanensis TaxID=2656650 RepID=A0A6A9UXY4_9ACTN|nr:hypothetical protein [Auraticoccus cholistanensis]MVA76592.1 hypothetical protein [Auraticoccus cholistanensis]
MERETSVVLAGGARRAAAVLAAGAVLTAAGAVLPAAAEEVEFTIDDPEVTESSGLARDTVSGWYWTVDDSGGDPRVFAVDESGRTRGTVSFRAEVSDVEAVARTPDGLYVADIGDNERRRELVTVYRLTSPQLGTTSVYNAWDLRYADGEAHDAEAMVVTADGQLLVFTKEEQGGIWATGGTPTGSQLNTLQRVGDAPAWITDATVLDDGRIAVRSYTSVSVLDPDGYQVVASAPLPLQPQGESITQSLDGEALLVGSEGRGSQVLRVPVPEAVAENLPEGSSVPPTDDPSAEEEPAPSASAEAPGEGQPAETPAGDAGEEPAEDAGAAGARTGTLVAVLLAAVLALAAGAVAFLVGRGREDAPAGATEEAEAQVDETGAEGTGAGQTGADVTTEVTPAASAATAPEPPAAPEPESELPPGPAPEAEPEDGPRYELLEERPGRVTWSEPADVTDGGPAGRDGGEPARPHDVEADLRWLYEQRGR